MTLEITQLPNLSESTVDELKSLRNKEPDKFYALVKALRQNRWPLRAIATPLEVSRSAVSIWESNYSPNVPLPLAEKIPDTLSKELKPSYSNYEIDEEEQLNLKNLAYEASKVRRYTDIDAPARKAAQELENRLHYHKEQGASYHYLATICGVSRRAIAQRLEKRDK